MMAMRRIKFSKLKDDFFIKKFGYCNGASLTMRNNLISDFVFLIKNVVTLTITPVLSTIISEKKVQSEYPH